MKLQVLNLDNTNEAELYKTDLENFTAHCPFYKLEFIKMFCTSYEGASAFLLYNDSQNLVVLMPFYLRKIDLASDMSYFDIISTYGYGGPLFHHDIEGRVLKIFWEMVDDWYEQNNVVSEFIRFNLINNILEYSGTLIPTMHNIMGKLIEPELQKKGYHRKVRKNVKRAKRKKLDVVIYDHHIPKKAFDIFFDIYIDTMKRTEASEEFIYQKQKLEAFIHDCKAICVIAICYKDETPISSELILLSKNYAFSFLGGTITDYFIYRPNDFLKHQLIKWAFEMGFKYFVLGGGHGKDDGIYNYKKSFFPNDVRIFYTGRKIVNQNIYNSLSHELMNPNEEYDIEKDFFPLYRKENTLKNTFTHLKE